MVSLLVFEMIKIPLQTLMDCLEKGTKAINALQEIERTFEPGIRQNNFDTSEDYIFGDVNSYESFATGLKTNISVADKSKPTENALDAEAFVSGYSKANNANVLGFVVHLSAYVPFVMSNIIAMSSMMWLRKWSDDATILASIQYVNHQYERLIVYTLLCVLSVIFYFIGSWITEGKETQASTSSQALSPVMWNKNCADGTFGFQLNENSVKVLGIITVLSYEVPILLFILVPLAIACSIIQNQFFNCREQLDRIETAGYAKVASNFGIAHSMPSFEDSIRVQATNRAFYSVIDLYSKCCQVSSALRQWIQLRLHSLGALMTFSTSLYFVFYKQSTSESLAGLLIGQSIVATQYLNQIINLK
ncbi:hypothetical protein HDE_11705 [Halotydeus destructor]|nr:hypothetical protein HDE_11705 [Halotydeus destructor]